jgi:hypothetical protein
MEPYRTRAAYSCLLALVLLTTLPRLSRAQQTILNTPEGFQQQYHATFESYLHHNERALQSRLDTFAIPAHWFADTFGPDRGPALAAQYASEFSEFKRRTAESYAAGDTMKAKMQVDPATPLDIRTRPWTPADDTKSLPRMPALRAPLPSVQKFDIHYVLAGPGQSARLTSWIDSFLYIDGAFRFFGSGTRPFWISQPKPEI